MFVINIVPVISNLSFLTLMTYVPLSTITQFLRLPPMFRFITQVMSRCIRPSRVAMYVEHNTETHLCNHCCCRKAISITYTECVYVALVNQPANCIHHITVSYVACLPVLHFCTYLIKGTILGKKHLLTVECVFWFCLQHFYENCLVVKRIQRNIVTNVHRSSFRVPVTLVRF